MLLDAFRLDNRVAIVTGAGKGIGRAAALGLAECGANVVCVARTQADIDEVAAQIEAMGVGALAVSCDVRDETQLASMLEQAAAKFNGIDILVNNAGAAGKGFGSIEEVDKARFEYTVDINLTSVYTLCHLCLPWLRKSRHGAIVNVSSALSWMVDKRFASYAAAKAGVNQMTRVLAYELAPHIRVNAVAPGAIDTPSTSFITSDPQRLADTERWIPLQRLGKPEELALAIMYLASDASSFVSGKVLEVDGGMQALPGSAIQETLMQQ